MTLRWLVPWAHGMVTSASRRGHAEPLGSRGRELEIGLDLDPALGTDAYGMTTKTAIQIRGLTKSFGDKDVLTGVDLDVPTGQIVALLGSNGAGKTTIVRILSTLLKPDHGSAAVQGFDVESQPERVRESISLTGQFAAVARWRHTSAGCRPPVRPSTQARKAVEGANITSRSVNGS